MDELPSSRSRHHLQRLLSDSIHEQLPCLRLGHHRRSSFQSSCLPSRLHYRCYVLGSCTGLHCLLSKVSLLPPRLLVVADIEIPSSYGLAPNDTAPSTRPAWNGKCYTNLNSGATLQMTLYGTSSLSNTNAFTVSTTGMQAYAIPYEGIAAAKVAPVSVPATPTSSSSVPPATYTVRYLPM